MNTFTFSQGRLATLRKVWAGFLMLSLNLSIAGVGTVFLTSEFAYAADTTLKSPTNAVSPNEWTNSTKAFSSNNEYATASDDSGSSRDDQRYTDFNFSVPSGSTIDGIEVTLEGHSDSALIESTSDGSFGTGSTVTDVPGWSEDSVSGSDTTVALAPGSGDDTASPNDGRFARIASDGYICYSADGSGFSGMALKYYWRGDSDAEDSESGTVEYKTGNSCSNSGSWTTLATHELDNNDTDSSSWSSLQSVSIPNLNTFVIRFKNGNQSASNENFRVDGVSLTGSSSGCKIESRIGDGSNFSSYKSATLTGTDAIYTLGGPSDLWSGVTWTSSDFSNANFRLEVRGDDPDSSCSDNAILSLDHVQAKVHYTAPPENTLALCTDGLDNDADEQTDLSDSDCAQFKPTIKVIKHVDGGEHLASFFDIFVRLTDEPFTAVATVHGNEDGTTVTVNPGSYNVQEDEVSGYTTTYDGTCNPRNLVAGDHVTCTVTNTYVPPPVCPEGQTGTPPNCVTPPPACDTQISTTTVVSDTTNIVEGTGGQFAFATFVHSAWTSITGSTWIWDAFHVAHPDQQETKDFTKEFTIAGTATGVTLDVAADNGFTFWVNGTQVAADSTEFNYSLVKTYTIDPTMLVNGVNTVKMEVVNFAGNSDPESNPAGALYKLTVAQNACVPLPPHVPSATVVATKVVCNNESDLPDWSGTEHIIDANSAQAWVDQSDGACHIAPDWKFQWSPTSAGNPGDNVVGEVSDWNTFISSVLITLGEMTNVWVREVYDAAYIPFTGTADTDTVSAEMYCNGDALHYDNLDYANGLTDGGTVYCVAFNTLKPVVEEEKGSLIIVKKTVGGDGEFTFSVTGPEFFENPSITTEEGTGSTAAISLEPNTSYTVDEPTIPEGWDFTSVSCVYDDVGTGETGPAPTSHVISVAAGETVTCTYTNTKRVVVSEEDDVCPNISGIQGSLPSGKKFDEGRCVDISVVPPPPVENNGAVGLGFLGGGSNNGGGLVLGASTSTGETCTEYITDYLRMGTKNNPEQVKLLQIFLNKHLNLNIPVTGFFGPLTRDAVKQFQLENADQVLTPWVPYGLSVQTPTGYVYKTTKRWINLLECKSLNTPLPQLP